MKQHADLLIELGTEELPPKALRALSEAFAGETLRQLDEAGFAHGALDVFATPRRLAFRIRQLQTRQPDREVERRGPALQAAFDGDGNPTRAALGFAQSVGLEVSALETVETEKGAWLVARVTEHGRGLADVLPDVLEQSVQRLPIPRRMRWGSRKVQFVRPVHWLVALLDDEVLELSLLDLRAGRETRGHRFHAPEAIALRSADEYEQRLERDGRVIVDFARRRELIREQAVAAGAREGGVTRIDEDLLDEVTALVEWPVALVGHFEKEFLRVPQEALITTMEENQKYFPVLDAQGNLRNGFVFISNLDSPHPDKVIAGNEKVVRPRLADAAFFYDVDRKKPLAEHARELEHVVFQQQLGTVADKVRRIAALARHIAGEIGGDPALAEQAGLLAKADLATSMVYEFDTMQGVMGSYLARHEGLPDELADALREQYLPRFSGDALPATRTGMALALADRLDTLVGIFGIGQKPTGDRDPFALRRAALGVLRIIIENELTLDIHALVDKAAGLLGDRIDAAAAREALEFIEGRYRAMYQERGVDTAVILSVLAVQPRQPLDFDRRVRAVDAFRALPEARALAAANKRVANILAKSGTERADTIDPARLEQTEERALYDAVEAAAARVSQQAAASGYDAVLADLAALRAPVDAFFDNVMVMAEDAQVRANRLALLGRLRALFLRVADISELD